MSEFGFGIKIFWSVMLCLSLAALGFSVYNSFNLSFRQILTLAIAVFISAILSSYQFRIKNTQTVLSAKELLVFWGVIWLGAPGAVFLAASSSLTRCIVSKKSKKQSLFAAYVHISATCISANLFYLILQFGAGFTGDTITVTAIPAQWLIIALTSMMAAHYLLFSLLTSTFLTFESRFSFTNLWRKNFAWTAASYFIAGNVALIAHLIFLEFGLGFGLIVLPIVIFAHVAYRIHLRGLDQKTREISEASRIHLATVEALATAIDARDQVGMGHVRRTQIYAIGIGESLGLSSGEIQALNTAALLHDIGKLAVPDHILNKPGRLTSAEMEKAKIHSAVGASILEKIAFPYPVVPTVKHHHEMWDGSGYPDGLMKEEIPLTARILTVADTYDTLRGARPYRPAVSRDEARRFLLNNAGKQYDPKIVDVFLRNLRHFEAKIDAQGLSYNDDKESEFNTWINDKDEQNYVEQIKRANREVFTLYELAKVFGASLNLKDTLTLFSEKVNQFVPFDTCVIYLLNESEEEATAAFVKGKNSAGFQNKRVKIGDGATGYAMGKRHSVYNVNPKLDFPFSQDGFVQEYSALAAVPLIANEKLIGAVSLYACELRSYEEEHLRLLETISRIAADAIVKSLQHAETESRALTDPMTQLPNARCLQMQFEKELARASRNGTSFQVLMLDLDGFKAVNDTFGHKAGDKMLKEISRVMRAQLRDYDFLARYAGDEFVVILPETNQEDIQELCERMETSVKEFALPVGDDKFARVGVSLGAACYPKHGQTLDQIIIAADKAMYAIKASRKQKMAAGKTFPHPADKSSAGVIEDSFIVELDESHVISAAIN